MKAIVYRKFGSPDVLRCEEIEKPVPGDKEVLIRVHAAGLNPLDWKLMNAEPRFLRLLMGLQKVKRPGVDVAGVVEAVGKTVTAFKPGDAVFGACRGALAEYACARSTALALKPESVTWEQAAAVPVAAWTAQQGLRNKAQVQRGEKVLINGASGGVGTFAVQIAKHMGAEVTGVCSAANVDLVRRLGADRVIDYTREDFTRGEEKYDAILDCIGNHAPGEVRRVLEPRGRCVLIGAAKDAGLISILGGVLGLLIMAPFRRQKIVTMLARRSAEDLRQLARLMESGKVRPAIDRCYGLSETADALRYLKEGHVRGKVIVTVTK